MVTAVIVVLVVVVVVVGVAVVATYSSSSNGRVVVGANRGSGRVAEVLPAPILAAAVFPALAAGRGRLLLEHPRLLLGPRIGNGDGPGHYSPQSAPSNATISA